MVTRGPAVLHAFTTSVTPITTAVTGTSQTSEGTQRRLRTCGVGSSSRRPPPASVPIVDPHVPNEPRVEAESGNHGGHDDSAEEDDAQAWLGSAERLELQE